MLYTLIKKNCWIKSVVAFEFLIIDTIVYVKNSINFVSGKIIPVLELKIQYYE